MSKSRNRHDAELTFSRRTMILASGQAILGGAVASRLLYLSVAKSGDYKSLSDVNRIKVRLVLPKRGLIYDRQGMLLADNHQSFRLVFIPEQVSALKEKLVQLRPFIPMPDENIEDLLKEVKAKPKFAQICAYEKLTWEQVCRLSLQLDKFEGFSIESGWIRYYPEEDCTAHVLGYVQTPASSEKTDNPLYRLADFRLGKTGIEKTYEEELQGQAGYKQIEVNARNRTIRELTTQPPVTGKTMHMSIHGDLQQYTQERLSQEQSGTAVVMNVHSGEVLSLCSAPSFDPNLFPKGIPKADWNGLLNNIYRPLHNKSIQGLYAPGSIFKTVVALAALEAEVIDEHTTIPCHGYIELNTHRFHCWHKHGGHGPTDLVRALRESCDVFFYEIAQKVGIDKIAAMAQRLGYGETTGIELPGEKQGLIPTKSWKRMVRGQSWRVADTILAGIGQGAILVTPLQMTLMMSRLLNSNQKILQPSLMKGGHEDQDSWDTLNLDPKFMTLIKQGLDETVNSPLGLAYNSRIAVAGFEMGGKTATTQVRRITMEERSRGVLLNEQRPWEHRDHGMFCGYAPVHNPKYAITVLIEHGGGGGKVAAPIARDILYQAQLLKV